MADYTEEEWNKGITLNLTGPFLCSKEVVPYMKEKKYGKIINISSLGWGAPPMPAPHYHATKAGLIGLINDLVRELSPYNIYTNTILPVLFKRHSGL